MISEKVYERLKKRGDKFKGLTIEEVSAMVDRGKKLIENHGEEGLPWKFSEEELKDAGAFFNYRTASNDSNYE